MRYGKFGLALLLLGMQALQPIGAAEAQSAGQPAQADSAGTVSTSAGQDASADNAGSCVRPSGEGNAQTLLYTNDCHTPMQFTINWLGTGPGKMVTYRIGQTGMREVKRQDRQAVLLKEVPAALGHGEAVTVTVRTSSVGSSHMLYVKNRTPSHLFVVGEIDIVRNEKVFAVCRLADTVRPLTRVQICPYADGDTVEIKKLVAEKDPN